jgi:flagellar motor switch protein FliN
VAGESKNVWESDRLSHWLVRGWAEVFPRVVRTLDVAGGAAALALEAAMPEPLGWADWENPLWFDLRVNAAEGGILSAGCTVETARILAQFITGVARPDPAAAREAFQELLSQAGGSLSTILSEHFGRTVEAGPATPSSQPVGAAMGVEFRFVWEDQTRGLALVPNARLLEALASLGVLAGQQQEQNSGFDAPRLPAGDSDDTQTNISLSKTASKNLQMLMEVELELSVSFGRTTLLLQEVMKLASGSIIELDRSVTDPVEVLVNNAVIGRAEVVVVDGNYGVRMIEVASRQERIRSIF